MPSKRKANLSRNSRNARALKVSKINETFPQAELHRLEEADHQANFREADTPDTADVQLRHHYNIAYLASKKKYKLHELSQQRLKEEAGRKAISRAAESIETKNTRKIENAQRMARRRQSFTENIWNVFTNKAFEYDSGVDYGSHSLIAVGKMNNECQYCKALKWKEETPGLCCSGGKISIPTIEEPIEPLKSLFMSETNESRRFLKNIKNI